MNGTFVNTIAIIIGSLIGISLKSGFIKEKSNAIMGALGLSVVIIGLQGVIQYQSPLKLIVALALGVLIGEVLDLDNLINRFARRLEKRFTSSEEGRFAQGFVGASILFGVGAMAIVGSIQSGLESNETILYTKSLLDFISSIVYASTFGWGVLFSGFVILVYQGSITLLSSVIAPFLNEVVIADIGAIGSALVMAIGLNMLNITKLKLANFLPSIFVVILISFLLLSI
jgi:uncharacterized membrane protein YqgA involved in biofilm formation